MLTHLVSRVLASRQVADAMDILDGTGRGPWQRTLWQCPAVIHSKLAVYTTRTVYRGLQIALRELGALGSKLQSMSRGKTYLITRLPRAGRAA